VPRLPFPDTRAIEAERKDMPIDFLAQAKNSTIVAIAS
jgi:hypothetical protein